MQDRPTVMEYLQAVTHFLDEEAVPNLTGSRQFYGRVAANVLRAVMRELENQEHDLFAEWEKELGTMESPALKASSRQKLSDTRAKYASLEQSMTRAEQSMEPVLRQFRDQVLYLKHNLNAQAIGALKGEATQIENEIKRLVKDMDASIAEADAFIRGLP